MAKAVCGKRAAFFCGIVDLCNWGIGELGVGVVVSV